jgi:hypothetical protein
LGARAGLGARRDEGRGGGTGLGTRCVVDATRRGQLREEANERRANPTFRMCGQGKALAAVALRLHQASVDDVCRQHLHLASRTGPFARKPWPLEGTLMGRAVCCRERAVPVWFLWSRLTYLLCAQGSRCWPAGALAKPGLRRRVRARPVQEHHGPRGTQHARCVAPLLLAAPPLVPPTWPCTPVCWLLTVASPGPRSPLARPSLSAIQDDPGPLPPTHAMLQTGPPRRATASASWPQPQPSLCRCSACSAHL